MVAAGYCMYSATMVLVLTLGSGVLGSTLDPDRQIFLQTHPNMRIPDMDSMNQSLDPGWLEAYLF